MALDQMTTLTRRVLKFECPAGIGEVEVPILGEVNERTVRRVARTTYYALVHRGEFGDLLDIQIHDDEFGHVAGSTPEGRPL